MARLRKRKFVSKESGRYSKPSDLISLVENFGVKNKFDNKDNLLRIVQLCFDGLIENEKWKGKKEFIDWLMKTGVTYIGDFYRNKLDVKKMKDDILKHSDDIFKYGDLSNNSKSYHLLFEESKIYDRIFETQELEKNGYIHVPEVIVPVVSEGFESSFLLGSVYKNAIIFPMRYSHCSRYDGNVKFPKSMPEKYITENIKDKKVTVIEGTVASGRSLGKVCDRILQEEPSSLMCCCINDSMIGREKINNRNNFDIIDEAGKFGKFKF